MNCSMTNQNYDIYQTPWGDWAFAAYGVISDGYKNQAERIRRYETSRKGPA